MDEKRYTEFTRALVSRLEKEPQVLGVVALGSMARRDTQPDDWSDHDFFVVTEPGAQEQVRRRRDWLPDSEKIVLHFRETAHGVKALYGCGHLIEFAVFDLEELSVAKVNRYRVLWDKNGEITRKMEALARSTAEWVEQTQPADDYLIGQFLTNLYVGVGRYARGERLSGRHFIKCLAAGSLLRLLTRYTLPTGNSSLDNLDPLRRFESAFPNLGEELNWILEMETPQAGLGLLELAKRELEDRMTRFPQQAWEAVYQATAILSPRPRSDPEPGSAGER